jgi:glycine cleavage system aminomethyltransferase T
MPFATTRMIDVGYARARAARMSYVGGPGYELYVPTDQCVTLYDALWDCGAEFRLARCRLLHDRRAAHRGRTPRMGRGAVA